MLSLHILDSGTPRRPEAARYCKELIQMIVIQSYRLSSCEFSSPYTDFWSYWSLPVPNLRRLVVHGRDIGASQMFGGRLPRLETLASAFYIPWLLGNYTSLRQVDLRNHGQYRITLTLLLDALRGCKTLEKLSLHGYARMDNGTPRSSTISLPRLSELNLFSSDSALILEHLETPLLTGPVVIFDSNPEDHILRSIPRVQRYAPYLEGITKLSVVLNSHTMQFSVTGYREDGIVALYIGVCGVENWYRLTWVRESIQAIALFVHFSGIRILTLFTDAPVVPWTMWLQNLKSVVELAISCPRPENLLLGLHTASPEDGLLPCPSLESLALYRCEKCTSVDHTSLMGFVISRYRVGRPLRKLKLHKCEWDLMQQRDKLWATLAQSQCAYLIGETMKSTDALLAAKGDNVLIHLPPEVDIKEIVSR